MDWSQVLYAGLGGGTGAFFGSVIAIAVNKRVKNKKYHSLIMVVFAVPLTLLGAEFAKSQYGSMKLPRIGSSVEQQLLGASPIFVEMKKYEPEYFNKIIKQTDKSARKGSDEITMINEGRAVVMELLADKNKYADDEAQRTIMEITLQNYSDYKANKPYLCVQMINQRSLGDVQPYVSKASAKLEEQFTIKMIRLPRVDPKPVDLTLAEISQKSIEASIAEFVQPGDDMDPPKNSPREILERVCDLGTQSIELILELPENQRANYLRHILGG
ncbi:MAG: hypothetical protein L3J65_03130 [Robiginitomaculum sp.]|nr:hypothetical protein [Robiginitomaculum sp.]